MNSDYPKTIEELIDSHTVDELDGIVMEHRGILASLGAEYSALDVYPLEGKTFKGGWGVRAIATQGRGDRGWVVLVPKSRRARHIWRDAWVVGLTGLGLTQAEAARIASAQISHKFEICAMVEQVLHGATIRLVAWLAHPREFGPSSGRSEWLGRFGEVAYSGFSERLTAPREAALAALVAAAVGPETVLQ